MVSRSMALAKTRIFLPLKSAIFRMGVREPILESVVQLMPTICTPFFSPSVQNAFLNSGSCVTRYPCIRSSNTPGADRMPNRLSMPTMKSGGITAISIVPNCTPSIMRGIVPSWLSGKTPTVNRSGARFSTRVLKTFIHSCVASLIVGEPILMFVTAAAGAEAPAIAMHAARSGAAVDSASLPKAM